MPDSTLSRRSVALHARLAKYPSGNHKIIPRILIDEDGTPITESGKPAAINHDLDMIAEQFVCWGREQGFTFLQGP